MAQTRRAGAKNTLEGQLAETVSVLQNLFLLEGLKAGMKGKDIRKILRIDQWRVSNISKTLKSLKNGKNGA
jgi:hypothetical protein